MAKRPQKSSGPIRLDLGCGPNKKAGFLGVDVFPFVGVDVVCDLASSKWPWPTGSVAEAHCSHVIEHLTNLGGKSERIHFFNELYRVLAPGGTCQLILPHWDSPRYYGDPTHKEPFSEWGFLYLNAEWRRTQAPHTDVAVLGKRGYSCDFVSPVPYGYSLRSDLQTRSIEYQQFALQNYRGSADDLIATLTKKV